MMCASYRLLLHPSVAANISALERSLCSRGAFIYLFLCKLKGVFNQNRWLQLQPHNTVHAHTLKYGHTHEQIHTSSELNWIYN